MFKSLFLILLIGQSFSLKALTELSGSYGFDRTRYGEQKQNRIISEYIRSSIAFYFFNQTGLELNYAQSETKTTEKNRIIIDGTYDIINSYNKLMVHSYGMGIRQAFARKAARLRPSLSLGYARRFLRSSNTLMLENKMSGSSFEVQGPFSKRRDDSVFATLGFRLRLTRFFSLKGSIHSLFKAFEFHEAQDNVKYLFGFSWIL